MSGRGSERRVVMLGAVLTAGLIGLAACGGDSSSLSEQAQRGKEAAATRGCTGCHGANGQGGVGPAWVDLAGSERVLVDGSTVVADDAYLLRAITDPSAEAVEGYSLAMPLNSGVTPQEADDIVAYIKELVSAPSS